jgi:hypothetical protein
MDDRDADRQELSELASLADDLLTQATEIRRQWTELAGALGVDAGDLPPASPAADEPAVENADPARLVALDMMLSGRSREEVAEYLREAFGPETVEPVIEDVFSQYGG